MSETDQSQRLAELEARCAQQEASLATYKETLDEIYALYATGVEELSFIRRLSDSLRLTLDQKKVCLAMVEIAMEELTPDGCFLLLLDRAGRFRLKASARLGQPARYWPEGDPVQDEAGVWARGPLGRAAATGQPVLLPDFAGQGFLAGARSLLALPLISRQEAVGVFGLFGQAPDAFSDRETRVLTIICDQAAAALYGVRLITEVRRASRAVRRSERKARLALDSLARLLENATDLILTLDQEGRIAYVNRRVQALGLDPQALRGQPLTAVVDLASFDPGRLRQAHPGPVEELPLREADPAGRHGQRTALVSFTPLPPGDRTDPAWLVIARDITERKQLERQLLHSEKLASVGLLAAGVAHEIGNPLAVISGYAQFLRKHEASEEARREFAQTIEAQAGRIEKIIQELLAYSRPASGVRGRLRVNEVGRTILTMLTNQQLFRGLAIETRLDPAEPEVLMDRDHLAQVLINLLVNAAQALSGSGRITLSTSSSPEAVVITVADDGPGVPAEVAGRIFDPFFTTKPVGQGTGLGLSICYRLVESEGGLIRLAQAGGPGAAFEVVLPLAPEET